MSLVSILSLVGGGLVAAVSLWFRASSSGKNSEINKQNKEVLKNVKASKNAVDASNDSGVDGQLDSLLDDANGK